VSLTISPDSAQQTKTQSLLDTDRQPVSSATEKPSLLTSAAIVRQEANLLRFPFFALGRKGLRSHKGLLIRGQSKIESQSYDFEYCITCNSNDLYPGQLARKVHMGLLRIMQTKQGFPFANPIEFTWRELMETIGLRPGGRTIDQLKLAIRSIEGTRIRSKFALKNAEGNHLKGRERGYGLYSEYVFFDELMPDNQTVASKNFVWLADWYLANINSLYCSPLDHNLWQYLDEKSPIASRMYEFFTFNFAGDWQTLTIDYEKLARFLPVREKKHLSQIEQQLETALALTVQTGILAQTTWQRGKHGQPQLAVRRGRMLTGSKSAPRWSSAVGEIESTEIQELYRQSQPDDELASQFHALWNHDDACRPTAAERAIAREIIAKYGVPRAEELLPRVVEIMRAHFPQAKSFGATRRYWVDAETHVRHEQTAADRRKQQFIGRELEDAKALQEKADLAQWQNQWDRLPAERQQAITRFVLSTNSPLMRLEKHPAILHRFCLKELGKRQSNDNAA
jgi:hypothetical protein